jgi:hypothetical protein
VNLKVSRQVDAVVFAVVSEIGRTSVRAFRISTKLTQLSGRKGEALSTCDASLTQPYVAFYIVLVFELHTARFSIPRRSL